MLKVKKIILFSFVLMCTGATYAQNALALNFKRNSAWVDFKDYAVCPNVSIEYQVINWSSTCHTLTVVNGFSEGDVTSDVTSDGKINITWKDNGDSCWIKVGKKTDQSCNTAPIARNFFIPVLSLKKVKPTITQTPSGKLDVGFIHDVTYKASAQYPWLGRLDSLNLNDFKLTEFVWTIPSGWTFNGSSQFETINVETNLGTGGMVTARAYNKKCLAIAESSSIGEFKADRKMPSPCFPSGPPLMATQYYELCGQPITNTFNAANVPINFQSPPEGVSYTWSVSPSDGWVKTGELQNVVVYKTDAQKTRTVSVTASAYGVSSSCQLTIPLRLTNPLTQLKGDAFICTTDTFLLSHPLPAGSNSTWKVESLTPGLLPSVTPTSGTGLTAILTANLGGGTLNKITFKIKGCNDSLLLIDTFFAGKPSIIPEKKTGGLPLGYVNFFCPKDGSGSYYMSVSTVGDSDNCINSWSSTGASSSYGNCNEFNFTLQSNPALDPPYNTVYITAFASNACGTTSQSYVFVPTNWGCRDDRWKLVISPNPAISQATIELFEKSNEDESFEPRVLNTIEILTLQGNPIMSINSNNLQETINTSSLQPGQYLVRTVSNSQMIIERLVIQGQ
jgi:Secretion system C-terminal sorting domain